MRHFIAAILTVVLPPFDCCRDFVPPGPHDKSIFYSEASGRLGNNLLNYAFLLQIKISLGVEVYMSREGRESIGRCVGILITR